VDLHTHLSASGTRMRWGIDEMLCYHYLTAQFLASADITADTFFALPSKRRAELVWQALFVNASPVSEACRGVITTLHALGLKEEVASRDLEAVRAWYAGQDGAMFTDKMFRLARLRYVVMSLDLFAPPTTAPIRSSRYRWTLDVTALVEGRPLSEAPHLQAGHEREWMERCCHEHGVMYLVADCPHDLLGGDDAGDPRLQRLHDLIVPTCRKLGVPLALQIGTRRGVNQALKLAGDGLGRANVAALGRLCVRYPDVKFMATSLSRENQHELCVLGTKLPNLHIYGVWWLCNNPSVVREVTTLRMEMLGTAFTAQTSSARVHDQLIYKWIHARQQVTEVLVDIYSGLTRTGWALSRHDVRRDVNRIFGGAFEAFLRKKLIAK